MARSESDVGVILPWILFSIGEAVVSLLLLLLCVPNLPTVILDVRMYYVRVYLLAILRACTERVAC